MLLGFDDKDKDYISNTAPRLVIIAEVEQLDGSGLWELEFRGRENQVTVRVSILMSIVSLDIICMEPKTTNVPTA